MTKPNVVNDLLIEPPSRRRSPMAPLFSARSEPAKSTKLTLLARSPVAWNNKYGIYYCTVCYVQYLLLYTLFYRMLLYGFYCTVCYCTVIAILLLSATVQFYYCTACNCKYLLLYCIKLHKVYYCTVCYCTVLSFYSCILYVIVRFTVVVHITVQFTIVLYVTVHYCKFYCTL